MPEPSDATLVRRSVAGDRDAFVQLVCRHERPLAALIRRHIGERHHAEDVLQETLLKAWAGLPQLRDPRKVRAWLLQVARNRCRDFYKSSQRRHRPTDDRELESKINRFGRAAARNPSDAVEVADALSRIPAAEREAARLFYLNGLTISDIAERTRCPEGTIKRRLCHARRHLREAMGVARPTQENADE